MPDFHIGRAGIDVPSRVLDLVQVITESTLLPFSTASARALASGEGGGIVSGDATRFPARWHQVVNWRGCLVQCMQPREVHVAAIEQVARTGLGDRVRLAGLGVLGWNAPLGTVEVDVLPSRQQQLALADHRQQDQVSAELELPLYLPIQNREKISPSSSSALI